MLRLEGEVRGKHVARTCVDEGEAVSAAVLLLDGCALAELRLIRVLRSLETAIRGGYGWAWSAEEFSLALSYT